MQKLALKGNLRIGYKGPSQVLFQFQPISGVRYQNIGSIFDIPPNSDTLIRTLIPPLSHVYPDGQACWSSAIFQKLRFYYLTNIIGI